MTSSLSLFITAAFDDVMEALGKEYHGEVDYDTIGGFVMDLLGHVPEDNEKVTVHWENVEFKVLSSPVSVCLSELASTYA